MVASLVIQWETFKHEWIFSFIFLSRLAADAVILSFFHFIFIHSIIKNGEKRIKQCVN